MSLLSKGLGGAVAIAAVALMAGAAQATPYASGSFAVSEFTNETSDVVTTTSYDLTSGSFGSGTGDLVGASGSNLYTGPLDFTAGGVGSFDFNIAGLGSFDATNIQLIGTEAAGMGGHSVTYFVTGSFTVGGSFDNSGDVITGSELWTLNQSSVGSAVALNATFNAPAVPPTPVPEPATLALLGGGLAGLGAMVRRRKNKKSA